jgi:hypothetical protein
LFEVSRIAEQALARAKKIREEGAQAVQVAAQRPDFLEQEVRLVSPLRSPKPGR